MGLGAGNGMNFRHYPASIEEVVALVPELYLRAKAQEAALDVPVLRQRAQRRGRRAPVRGR